MSTLARQDIENARTAPDSRSSSVNEAMVLAVRLHQGGKLGEAERIYRHILSIRPNDCAALHLLGVIAAQTDHPDAAVKLFDRAIASNPSIAEYHANRGNALRMLTRVDEAISAYDQAVTLRPDYPDAWYNKALAELLIGNLSTGFEDYEWRWKVGAPFIPRDFSSPLWNGEPLEGRRILLYAEQGLGDTIQFIRYLPLVREAGGNVILEAQSSLLPLFRNLAGGSPVFARGAQLPEFDVACPLMSLPRAFRTTIESIPAATPYLHVPEEIRCFYPTRLHDDKRLRVGLAWAGNPSHPNDRNRSIHFSQLQPILNLKEVHFCSFQIGDKTKQLDEFRVQNPDVEITNLEDPPSGSLAETAAKFADVDLILSVDTSIAHLAGALNKPVWMLLAFDPDWRWMLDRMESPWYPSMRIYRQPHLKDWSGAIEHVRNDLLKIASTYVRGERADEQRHK